MKLYSNHFSNIYIEESIQSSPILQGVLGNFKNASIIYINDYKDVFFRKNQNFNRQKKSKSLILANKPSDYIYSASHFSQSGGSNNFFYNTLLMNCLYDCDYCYLQGLFPSSNIVCFLNLNDFYNKTRTSILSRNDKKQPLLLSLSYDSDLLAFENIIPYCRQWINFAYSTNDFVAEIRTKSANFRSISDMKPTHRVLFSWSISPQVVSQLHEHDAPSPQSRLSSMCSALELGWKVRLCFDPVIAIDNWKDIYHQFVKEVFQEIPADLIHDVTVGPFRMSSKHLAKARQNRPQVPILQREWDVSNRIASYSRALRDEISSHMSDILSPWIPREQISFWL